MNEQFNHAFTRSHVWIAAMVVVGALGGPGFVVLACGLIAFAHVILGIVAEKMKSEDTEDQEQ